MRRPTVLLFDIDGTLVSTGGAGRRAMERAFEALTGEREATAFPYAGMTDRAIVRAGMINAGRVPDERGIDAVLEAYVGFLREEVAAATRYEVYAGIRDAVDRASRTERVAVGLGTGNIRAGARIKLGRVDLHHRFAFGGFGCDDEDRGELIRIGAERGARQLGLERQQCRVVVIGDTVRDVDAALCIGAECLGVGTGGTTPAALLERGAFAAFESLAEPGATEAMLG